MTGSSSSFRRLAGGLRNVPVAMQAVLDPMLLEKVVAMSRAPEKDAGTALFVDCARVSTRIAPKVHAQPSHCTRRMATSTSQC